MDKKVADEELERIKARLQELDAQRRAITAEEHRLMSRQHELMFQFYPDVINEQIQKILELRRLRRS